MTNPIWRSLIGVIAVTVATTTYSAIVENITLGNAKALSLGNAVTADPPGVDSIHFNPAGLAAMDGRQYNLKVLAASMSFSVEFGGHDPLTQTMLDYNGYQDESAHQTSETSMIGLRIPFQEGITEWPLPVLILPLGGASYRAPGSAVTWATAVYAPMAAGYIRDEDDPARFMGQHLSLAKITYFAPSFGVQLSDRFAVGASLGFSWQGATALTRIRVPNLALAFGENLTRDMQEQGLCPAPGDTSPIINFCGQDPAIARLGPYTDVTSLEFDAESALVPNFNVGWLWDVTDWFSWGMVYQFESTAHMKGYYRLHYDEEWVNFFDGIYRSSLYNVITMLVPFPTGQADSVQGRGIEYGDAELDFITPAHFATGIKVKLSKRWQLNIDAKWTDWGAWDGLTVKFDQPLDFTKLASLVSPYSELSQLTIPRHYKSVWNWAFGLEYRFSEHLSLRAGYEPRKSSIPEHKQDVLLPLGDADLYGFGFEWRLPGKRLLEMGIGYLHASANVPAGTSTNGNSSDHFNNFIYNPYAGTDYASEVNAYLLEMSFTAPF